jgi:hypothetical protein
VDGVCKGAGVIDDGQAQICAYITDIEDGAEMELQYAYEGRTSIKSVGVGYVYDPSTGLTSQGNFRVHRGQEFYYFANTPGATPPAPPASLTLTNYPNPFNPVTTVSYTLPAAGQTKIEVFNVRGQLVKTLIDGNQAPGAYTVIWNGSTDDGNHAASGVYFIRLQSGSQVVYHKTMLMK